MLDVELGLTVSPLGGRFLTVGYWYPIGESCRTQIGPSTVNRAVRCCAKFGWADYGEGYNRAAFPLGWR